MWEIAEMEAEGKRQVEQAKRDKVRRMAEQARLNAQKNPLPTKFPQPAVWTLDDMADQVKRQLLVTADALLNGSDAEDGDELW